MKEFLKDVWNPFVDFLRRDGHWKHIAAGFALGLLSVLFAILAGLMKEEHDESDGGKFDYVDLACTVIGGMAGNITQVIVIMLMY